MISLKNMSTRLNKLANKFSNLKLATPALSTQKPYSDKKNNTPKPSSNIVLTEEIPPIPPDYGWSKDENLKTLIDIKRITSSFKYGLPPRLMRRVKRGPLIIRMAPLGHCANRPFFRLQVNYKNDHVMEKPIEDLGSFDPMPNRDNQLLCALNVERIMYHMGRGVMVNKKCLELLGLAGVLPVHPISYLKAFRNQKILKQAEEQANASKQNADKVDVKKEAQA